MTSKDVFKRIKEIVSKADDSNPLSCVKAIQGMGCLAHLLKENILLAGQEAGFPCDYFDPSNIWGGDYFFVLIVWNLYKDLPEQFEKAFALPLKWVKGEGDDERLPGALRKKAEELRKKYVQAENYGLRLLPSQIRGFDYPFSLASLEMEAGSAVPVMEGALKVAHRSYRCDPSITATVCFDENGGIIGVDRETLRYKLLAAKKVGIQKVYLAKEDFEASVAPEGLDSTFSGLELQPFSENDSDSSKALMPLFSALSSTPPGEASFDVRAQFFNDLWDWGDQTRAMDFYYEYGSRLLPDLAKFCAKRSCEALNGLNGGCLVSFLSKNPGNVYIVFKAMEPSELILFHTRETSPQENPRVNDIIRMMKGVKLRLIQIPNSSGGDVQDFLDWVRNPFEDNFIEDRSKPVVFDITPGPKPVSFCLYHKLKKYIKACLYLSCEMDRGKNILNTERILRLWFE